MTSKLRVLPWLILLLPLDLIVGAGLLLAVVAGVVQRRLKLATKGTKTHVPFVAK